MPGLFPVSWGLCNAQTYGIDNTISGALEVAAGASNTKGSWTELVAATTYDTSFICVQVGNFCSATAGFTDSADVGIGAGGSEKIIIADLVCTGPAFNQINNCVYGFPLCIPANTRIAARSQSSSASETDVRMQITLFDSDFTGLEGFAGVDAIGFTAASTVGTNIDPGATPDTKGAYSELVSSTSRDYAGFYIGVDHRNASGGNSAGKRVDIAFGAGGSETIILPDFFVTDVGTLCYGPQFGPLVMLPIPAGTRIAARAQSDDNFSARNFGLTLYGIYQ